ncbi:MAG: hypothetical protein R3F55_01700 [Alphaproteobacteria bacterium]
MRSAAAIPVEAVDATRAARDAMFGEAVRQVRPRAGGSQESGDGFEEAGFGAAADWHEFRLISLPSGPFLAQQLGQHARLVTPTLVANAEVGAYAEAQARAQRAATATESLLDIRA